MLCELFSIDCLPAKKPIARKYFIDKIIIRNFLFIQVNHFNLVFLLMFPGKNINYLIGQFSRAVFCNICVVMLIPSLQNYHPFCLMIHHGIIKLAGTFDFL